ncbi:MAG: PH domain-containing protein [Chloroflexota bacterium]|nr:PH domain-containing protein [Chloroflexota bacterium]
MSSKPPISQQPINNSLPQEPERVIEEFKSTRIALSFWFFTIITLGIYFILYHRYNKIILTNRRVTQIRGSILTQNETTISLQNVTDVTINRSFIGRILGFGDIVIQSAGSASSEINFKGIRDPERLRELMYDLRDGRIDNPNEKAPV